MCNYTKYFKLYASAPNMSAYAMEFINSDLRIKWLTTMAKAYVLFVCMGGGDVVAGLPRANHSGEIVLTGAQQ